MTDPTRSGFDIANFSKVEEPQPFSEPDDDEDAADYDDDDGPSTSRPEMWSTRADFGSLEWWSHT